MRKAELGWMKYNTENEKQEDKKKSFVMKMLQLENSKLPLLCFYLTTKKTK